MRAALAAWAPGVAVLDFPAWDCLPYDRVSPNAEISSRRMATLAALADGLPGAFVVLSTLNAVTQRIPARDVVRASSFRAGVGDRVDEARLRAFLSRMGFSPVSTVAEPGDFAIRGGIVDIYPPGPGGPVRLDFFGDVLDGARRFDAGTQRTVEKLARVDFAPVSEVVLDEAAITRFRQNYRAEFGAAGIDDPLYEAVSAGRKHQGMEHWLPFFHERLETLFDYLPDASVMLDDQVTPARLARWETVDDAHDARAEALAAKGRMDTVYKPVAAGLLYLDDAAWEAAVAGHRMVQLSPLPQSPGPGVLDAGGRIGRTFEDFALRHLGHEGFQRRVVEHLARLKLESSVLGAYPHELSGGMRQRVTIALATICKPEFIIADEPTTALDVVVQKDVLGMIREIQSESGSSVLFVTHDMGVHAALSDRLGIMYAGRLVEEAPTDTLFAAPLHPYTQHLIASLPRIGDRSERRSLGGAPPNLADPPPGCRFHPRCPMVMEVCRSRVPAMVGRGEDHRVACHAVANGAAS